MNTMREAVKEYLSMRRALGFKMHEAGVGLFRFVTFLEQKHSSHITAALAMEWAQQPTTVQPLEWARRLSFVRGFARYRSAFDPMTEIPECEILPYRPKRARPYLYKEKEILDLIEAALTLAPVNGFRGYTYYCLLGFLSVTGVRLGEALGLHIEDVDLAEGIITIRGAKFGKSRLVPLHASTVAVLASYKIKRNEFLKGRSATYFFISMRGNRLDQGQVRKTFYSLLHQIGIPKPGGYVGARLHDFRHVFAIETMKRWYRSGEDVERRLPVLSAYLGHVHVSDTYWYLTACPELMGQSVNLLEQRWETES
ncbi:tyrosine-type recombinase/integrase [soil metagenome]